MWRPKREVHLDGPGDTGTIQLSDMNDMGQITGSHMGNQQPEVWVSRRCAVPLSALPFRQQEGRCQKHV
jgi:hypothetical protein